MFLKLSWAFRRPSWRSSRTRLAIATLVAIMGVAVLGIPGGRRNVASAGAPPTCSDVVLIGQNGWASLPVAKSRCDGMWSVENHLAWSKILDWSPGPAGFQAVAASAAATVAADFDGDGYSDLLTVAKDRDEAWIATSRADGLFHYTKLPLNFPHVYTFGKTPGAQAVVGRFLSDPAPRQQVALLGVPGWTAVPVFGLRPNDGTFFTYTLATSPSSSSATMADFMGWSNTQNWGAHAIAMDVNGDGLDDIVLVGGARWGSIPVAISKGDGTFTPYNIFGLTGNEPYVATGWSAYLFAQWAQRTDVTILPGHYFGTTPGIALVGGSDWGSVPVAISLLGNDVGGSLEGGWWIWNHGLPDFAWWARGATARVAGDFDGDGQTDIALLGAPSTNIPVAFRVNPYAGGFRVTNTLTPAPSFPPGWAPLNGFYTEADFSAWAATPGVTALTGDFNGDKKTDIILVPGPGVNWSTMPIAFSKGDGSFDIYNLETPGSDPGWGVNWFTWWSESSTAKPVLGNFVRSDASLGRTEPNLGPPKLKINAPWGAASFACPNPCTVNFTVSATDYEDTQLKYEWGVINGGNPASATGGCAHGTGPTATCTFNPPTNIYVSLRVTDGHGNFATATEGHWVDLATPPPVATTPPPVATTPPPVATTPPGTVTGGGSCNGLGECNPRSLNGQFFGYQFCSSTPSQVPGAPANTCLPCGRTNESCCFHFNTQARPDCNNGGVDGCMSNGVCI